MREGDWCSVVSMVFVPVYVSCGVNCVVLLFFVVGQWSVLRIALSCQFNMCVLGACIPENCIVFGSSLISTCANEVAVSTQFFNVSAEDTATIANLKIEKSQVNFEAKDVHVQCTKFCLSGSLEILEIVQ